MTDAPQSNSILDRWQIDAADLTRLVDENPSLRGMLFGYVAELKLSQLLELDANISDSLKYDDHDRTNKGDRVVTYKGQVLTIEAKSLQTNSIRKTENGWIGKAQVDASDRRDVELPNGSRLSTTLLLAGEFDILAINCFEFTNEWRWLFCKNTDIPRSSYRRYSEYQRRHLLASLVKVSWPPEPPFTENIFEILDELANDCSS